MTLGKKIVTSKLLLVIVPVAVVGTIAVWQSRLGFQHALATTQTSFKQCTDYGKEALVSGGMTDLAHQAEIVRAMCQAQQELLEQKVRADLNVARDVFGDAGAVSFSEEKRSWSATNQFTNDTASIELPAMRVGETELGQVSDAQTPAPVVDKAQQLVGGTCTIFQRMNSAGDMLRVCTNVKGKDGKRAIGTYIPVKNPDGTPNTVLAPILQGQTYVGRAFVVDRWYITAYEPIKDGSGEVVGMLYVGVPQESAASLRNAIMSVKVGKTGYVYVLNAKGSTRGNYVISYQGKRDGENIWEAKDADGKLFIQDICNAALTLKPGEIGESRYPWKNQGDATAREKVVKLAYFEPWDWVIGVGAYTDEFYDAVNQMESQATTALAEVEKTGKSSQATVVAWCGGVGGIAAIIGLFVALMVTRSITKPVNRIVEELTQGSTAASAAAAQINDATSQLAASASEQASSLEETSSALEQLSATTQNNAENAQKANDLVGQAKAGAGEGEQITRQLNDTMDQINQSSHKIQNIIKVIEEIAFQTNLLALNAAVEAARAGEHGKGFAVVAEEVRNLAQRAAGAARETTALIEESSGRARDGVTVTERVNTVLSKIASDVATAADLVNTISKASKEQAVGVNQINDAVSQMDKVTQSNAANAEESAAAVEQMRAQAESVAATARELGKLVGVKAETDGQTPSATKPKPKLATATRGKLAKQPEHAPSSTLHEPTNLSEF